MGGVDAKGGGGFKGRRMGRDRKKLGGVGRGGEKGN